MRVTGVTSGEGLPAGSRVFDAVTVHRRAAVRPSAPALSLAVVAAPLDVVVWSPGAARAAAIADLGDADYAHYVCVEPGRVSADTAGGPAQPLQPGKVWTLTQELRLHFVGEGDGAPPLAEPHA